MPDELTIARATASERAAALDLTFSALLGEPARSQHVRDLLAGTSGPDGWRGLWVARRGPTLAAATWAHFQPGSAVSIWPPRLVPGESGEAAERLLAAVLEDVQAAGSQTAQVLVTPEDREDIARISRAGFYLLAELMYLMSGRTVGPRTRPAAPVEFELYTPEGLARMQELIDRTYIGSLDCPGLNGIRSGRQLLDEYRAQSDHESATWFFLRFEGADVGCLLLADHPALDQFELVYLGLVPEVRGRGWGLSIVRYAQWLAATRGRQSLVLAVDAANRPAMAMYEAAGMVAWDRRDVYLKAFGRSGAEA